jgi:Txe/YoeB family toxin of Txe-Axe toxin-antitoxin module
LKNKLGLDISLEAILKQKGNQKEMQIVKEHKDAIDKTENYQKQNKEIEKKIEAIVKNIEDDEMTRREI